MPMNRCGGTAAVLLVGVWAGTMESSSGSPRVIPAPRKKVRRATCLLEINICVASLITRSGFDFSGSHLERGALNNPHEDRQEPVVIFVRVAYNRPDHRHILILDSPPEAEGHQLLSDGADELRRIMQQGPPQLHRTVHLGAIP